MHDLDFIRKSNSLISFHIVNKTYKKVMLVVYWITWIGKEFFTRKSMLNDFLHNILAYLSCHMYLVEILFIFVRYIY